MNDCVLGNVDNAVKNMQQLFELSVQQENVLSDYSIYQLFLVLSAIKSEQTNNKDELLSKMQEQKMKEQLKEFCISLVKEICINAKMKNQNQIELIRAIESVVSANICKFNNSAEIHLIAKPLLCNGSGQVCGIFPVV